MDRPEERLALIEVLGRDGHVVRTVDVCAWPVTFGRDLRNTVVLDDPQVAAFHAALLPTADPAVPAPPRLTQAHLTVGRTRNGVRLGRRQVAGGDSAPLLTGSVLQLGSTLLRVRLAGETLAPEQAAPEPPASWRSTLPAALALLAGLAAEQWLTLDPDADLGPWLAFLLGTPAALVAWCALWALASKLFQQRFDFVGHLGIAAPRFLLAAALGWVVPPIAAALGAPWLAEVGRWAAVVVGGWTLWAHARHVLPQFGRRFQVAALVLFTVGASVFLVMQQRRTDTWASQRYLTTLPWPGTYVGSVTSPEGFVQQAAALRAPLEERVRRAAREDAQATRSTAPPPAASAASR